MRHFTSTITMCVVLLSFRGVAAGNPPVEPLLQKYCIGCHNENDKEVGLSLQTPESLKKGSENGSVIDPANLRQSLLYQVLETGVDKSMPPEDEPQPSQQERQLLRDWVLAGAKINSMAAGKPDVPETKPFGDATPQVFSAAVSPDESQLLTGSNGTITALDVVSGKKIWSVAVEGKVSQLSFATSQPWAIAATGLPGVTGSALLVSTTDGAIIKTFGGHTDAVYAATLNKAETILATAGYDRRILLHDVASGNVLKTLEGHNGSVFSLSFDPAGDVVCSASADGTVKIWNVATGERLDTLSQPQAEQYSVVVSDNGKHIYATGADNRIRVWNLVSRNKTQINPLVISRFAHEQPITSLAISPDGSLLASAAEDGTLSVWTAWPLQQIQTLPKQDNSISAVAFIGNKQVVVGRRDGQLVKFPVQPRNTADSPAKAMANLPNAAQLSGDPNQVAEVEGNDSPDAAQTVDLPTTIAGVIKPDGGNDRDADCFKFAAAAGQQLLMEVKAQRDKSPLDSRIEVLTTDGKPILQTQLQAVRDSYFTFRGKDSDTSNDFRVFNWQEMELNEYLYSDGEVVKLWLYPRGPDSGFMVYPGFGSRHTYFGTTPTSHALQAPCFVVVPRQPGETITANGLPTFPVYFENDDDSLRQLGRDSRLMFTAPAAGEYVVRLTDSRGFSGPDFNYKLTIRSPRPSFQVKANSDKLKLQAGTGREIIFTATRIDGYNGPITVDAENLPSGVEFSGPIQIQQEQLRAFGTIYAREGAASPTDEQVKAIRFVASADGRDQQEAGRLKELKIEGEPKLRARVGKTLQQADSSQAEGVVLTIHPGETISAFVKLERIKHDGVVSLGKEDAGSNLPHGLYVDNIGLNGLLLLDGQSEREFFITAAKWVPASTSTFFLKTNIDGITSFPVTIQVVSDEKPGDENVTAAQR